MDPYLPPTGSSTNPNQVSGNADTDELRAQRRVIYRGVIVAIGLIVASGGIGRLMAPPTPSTIGTGIALIVVGLIPIGWWTLRGAYLLVQLRRIHLDQCAHCKYETRVLRKGKCPECGKDPFEPV